MVRAGEYRENVFIPRRVSGTPDAPIWLVSADGPQRARVLAVDDRKAAIGGGGIENFIVQGFYVKGGLNGIQFSQNGIDYTDPIRNIVIRRNVVEDTVKDCIKVNGGERVFVLDNIVRRGGDQGIDYLGIVGGRIEHNELADITGVAALFAKGGSSDILIAGNYLHGGAGDGMIIGGWMSPQFFRPGFDRFEARNIRVTGNRVEGMAKRPLNVLGGVDSIAEGNYLAAAPGYYTVVGVGDGSPKVAQALHSDNIVIRNNILTRADRQYKAEPGSGSVRFEGNRTGVRYAGDAGVRVAPYSVPALKAGRSR